MRVLLIEPTKLYQQLIGEIVADCGATTDVAETASEARQCVKNETYELVCISRRLPDMDGEELVKKIKNKAGYENVPVILLTSDNDDELHKEGFVSGVTEILDKSDVAEIKQAINHILSRMDLELNAKILFVEDDIEIANVIQLYLNQYNHKVDHFVSGEEAMNAFHSHSYDLVITDILLEGKLTGIDLLTKMRSMPDEKKHTPILMQSGLDNNRKLEALKMGANDFIAKPIQKEEFIVRSNNLIKTKRLLDKVKEQEKKLYNLAMTDHLTTVYNRHSFFEFAPKILNNAIRHQEELTYLVIDLDYFKNINDTYGHAMGDVVLSSVGKFLKETCRDGDIVARYGGEEFIVLLTHCDKEDGLSKAENIRAGIESLEPGNIHVTSSIGCTSMSKAEQPDLDMLFSAADKGVYVAKESGRNCVVYQPVNSEDDYVHAQISSQSVMA